MPSEISKRALFSGIFSGAAVLTTPALALVDPLRGSRLVDQKVMRHPTLASESNAPVGVQLVLALDTSGSMSEEEFEIQLQATAHALNSELVRNAIKYKAGAKSAAVCIMDFDGKSYMRIPWVDLRGESLNDKPYLPDDPANSSAAPDKLDMLAQEIVQLDRRGSGGTQLDNALWRSKKFFTECPWKCLERRVLDVFGDGSSRPRKALTRQRDELAAMGVTINGFAIVNEERDLEDFQRKYMITKQFVESPDGIFSEPGRVWAVARNLQSQNNTGFVVKPFFQTVATAMKQKISVEFAGEEDYYKIRGKLNSEPQITIVPTPA